MTIEELNVLSRFEFLTASARHLKDDAQEIIFDAQKWYIEIIEIRKRLAEIDNDQYFETQRILCRKKKESF